MGVREPLQLFQYRLTAFSILPLRAYGAPAASVRAPSASSLASGRLPTKRPPGRSEHLNRHAGVAYEKTAYTGMAV